MATSRFTVRRAGPEDLDFIVEGNAAMARETEGKELDRNTLRAGVQMLLSGQRPGFYLLAQNEGNPVGQLMVTEEWSDWRNGDFWWIQSVYVVPAARRQGVYRALYDHLLAEAKDPARRRDRTICGIRLYVDHDNTGAQKTYEDLGMSRARYHLYEVDFVFPGGAPSKV